eukprot:TRINITY_DN60580_c0_g1_i1.p1 TRINITY_DN60580_c0_g1~~TRINITY_DN60580_c0_g1_i1.p1  ORF type:complete len:492 (+),score=98.09 TRINITY_DN60580_c0_g1_i1:79-1554(+)
MHAVCDEQLTQEERERLRDMFSSSKGAASSLWQLCILVQQATGIPIEEEQLSQVAATVGHSFGEGAKMSCEQWLSLMSTLKRMRQDSVTRREEEEEEAFAALTTATPPHIEREPSDPFALGPEAAARDAAAAPRRSVVARHLAEFGINQGVVQQGSSHATVFRARSPPGTHSETLSRGEFNRLVGVQRRRLSSNLRRLKALMTQAARTKAAERVLNQRRDSDTDFMAGLTVDGDRSPSARSPGGTKRGLGKGKKAVTAYDALRQCISLARTTRVQPVAQPEPPSDATPAEAAAGKLHNAVSHHVRLLRWGDELWRPRRALPQYLDHRFVHGGEPYTHVRVAGDPLWLYRGKGGAQRTLLNRPAPRSRWKAEQQHTAEPARAPASPPAAATEPMSVWRPSRQWGSLRRPAATVSKAKRSAQRPASAPPPPPAAAAPSAGAGAPAAAQGQGRQTGGVAALQQNTESDFAAARRILLSRLDQELYWTAQSRLCA